MQNLLVWSPKALLASAAAMSFALNVAHAPPHTGARVVAALAPVALVLTFEILMMVVRRAAAARVDRLHGRPAGRWADEDVARVIRRAVTAATAASAAEAPSSPAAAAPTAAPAAARAGSPPRPRPAGRRGKLPEVDKSHQVQLDRANKQGPAEVERVMKRLGVPREAVAARPGRWQLPSPNGLQEVPS
jgi:hypothetical protein